LCFIKISGGEWLYDARFDFSLDRLASPSLWVYD
jgi:hypothetical protein